MMALGKARFDGRVFIPCQPVDLPAGTRVAVVLSDSPRQPTEEENLDAEFDGHVFVPREPVDLPPGTSVEVVFATLPRKPTEEDNRRWQEILQQLDASEPPFRSVEEALRYTRKRP
jgi:predicted DNA-binding antitoxin AbrB/MazE fold protein